MGKRKIIMKDIAKKLDVSVVTVSKALSGKDGVSSDLRKKIIEVAKNDGYQMNLNAKSMRTGFSYNIGILMPSYFFNKSNSFYLYYFRCIVDELNKNNYYGILQVVSTDERKKMILPRFCRERSVDGIIFLGQIDEEYVNLVKKENINMILSDFHYEINGVEAVVADNLYSAYELTNYLVELGHKKIGFVGKLKSTSSIQDRYLGYQKSLIENGLKSKDEWIICDRNEESIIYTEFEIPKNLPTAFICNNDEVAYYFVRSLKSNGYKIPDDISIVCFDNTIYSDISEPKITAFETNIKKMATLTVEHLLTRINNDVSKFGKTYISGKIIEKESCKKIENKFFNESDLVDMDV